MKRFYLSNLAILLVILLGSNMRIYAQGSSFVYTGGVQTYVVPAGVTSLALDMCGANGGLQYYSGYGFQGIGGRVQCVLTVSSGQTLNIYVGGAGTNGVGSCCSTTNAGGYNGGGNGVNYAGAGGGASDIRIGGTALLQRVVVAGGGGGGGDYYGTCTGGAGGGLIGGNGNSGGGSGYYGSGGTQTGGGAAASNAGSSYNGTFGSGGGGDLDYAGGGGGGWYGGGGAYVEGGGGGGSSYTSPTLTSGVIHTQAFNPLSSGNGYVNICPGPNTGTITVGSVCPGTTTTAVDAGSSSTGTWSTLSPNILINASTGVVTGLSAGTGTISYSVTNVCATGNATAVVTINPTPPNITAPTINLCLGVSTTLSDASTGGTWSTSSSAVTLNSASGYVTGVSAATVPITYTATTGCQTTTSIAVNASPPLHNVTGGGSYCNGGTGIAIGLNGSDYGIKYQLYNGATTEGTPVSGVGGSLSLGTWAPAGTYTVLATNTGSGCTSVMNGFASVTPYAPISVYTVTGGGSYCSGGTGVLVGLSGSTYGISYQLYNGVSTAGSAVIGTGGAISFGYHRTTGTRTAVATNTVTGCSVAMSGSVPVTINPVPSVYNLTTPDSTTSYCAGGTGVHLGLSGSSAGVNYQLDNGGVLGPVVAGTGSGLNFGLVTTTGSYTILASFPSGGCSTMMAGSATVSTVAVPTAYPVTGGGASYCTGGSGDPIGLGYSASGVNYQLYNSSGPVGSPVTGTSGALSFGNQTAGTYHVVASNGGCSNTMSGIATITANALPHSETVSAAGATIYCPGTAVPGISQSGSVIGTSYQLYNGSTAVGSAVAGTGSALTFTSGTGPGVYTVVGTIGSTGCSVGMSGSVNITTYSSPNIDSINGGGGYCAMGTGVPVGLYPSSDIGVNYQLYNGTTLYATVAGTGAPISFGNVTAAGNYTVLATNATTGCTSNMSGIAAVTINPLPSSFTVTGGGNYCSGSAGAPVNLSFSTPGVDYQLYMGSTAVGAPLGGTGGALNFGMQTAGTYSVVATSVATSCMAGMGGAVTINSIALPNAYAVSGTGAFCQGGTGLPVSLTSSDGGVEYQLFNGASPVGPVQLSLGGPVNFGVQSVPGTYTVEAYNPSTTCTNVMTGSAVISVNPAPTMHTVTGGGGYCPSGSGVYVGLDSSDLGITYSLYHGTTLEGTMAGSGGAFTFPAPVTAIGVYTVLAQNIATACTGNMSGDAIVTTLPAPVAYTVMGGGSYCQGGTGSSVNLSGSTSGIEYYLMNGSVVDSLAGTGSALNFGLQTTSGTYSVMATNLTSGCTNNMISSAMITINPLPDTFSVMPGGSYCAGGTGVDVKLAGSTSGINYELYEGSVAAGAMASTGGPVDFGLKTVPGTYTVTAINPLTGCTKLMNSSAVVTEMPNVTPSVTFTSATPSTVCAGTMGNFTATVVNGGSSPVYQWLVNTTTTVGTNSPALSYTPSDGQTITVKITSNAPCAVPATVTSLPLTFSVIANQTPAVSLSSTSTNVCQGSDVFFTASPSYGGTAPTYSWILDSTVIGTGSSLTYNAMPANGDRVFVIMKSNYACIAGTTDSASSTQIEMSVATPINPYVSVTANPGTNIKMNTNVTFTAHATGAGSNPMYQWSVNGNEITGATDSTYSTSNINNGDNFTCAVSGTNTCGTGTATSNQVIMSVENTTGVSVVNAAGADVKLLPNPNKGDFMVNGTLGTTGQQTATIEITNMLGQVVYKSSVVTLDGKINEHIQLNSGLANGMYMLNLSSNAVVTVFHFVVE